MPIGLASGAEIIAQVLTTAIGSGNVAGNIISRKGG